MTALSYRFVVGENFRLLKEALRGVSALKDDLDDASIERAGDFFSGLMQSVGDRIFFGDVRATDRAGEFERPIDLNLSTGEQLLLAAFWAGDREGVLRHLKSLSSECVATPDDDGQGRFVKSRPCSEGGAA